MKRIIAGMVVLLMCCLQARADWQEPKDRKFSEDQLKTYIATASDWLDEIHEMTVSMENAKTTEGKVLALGDLDKKEQACLDKHNISKQEFEWLSNRVLEAYNLTTAGREIFDRAGAQMQEQTKLNSDRLADAQKRLAIFQAAAKDGRRVISDEDRQSAIKAAGEDQKSIADEVKLHVEEAKAAEAEAVQHDADAKAADALAATPPAEVSADDRADYVQGKKAEAQTARDASNETRERIAEIRKSQTEAEQRAAAAGNRAAHPDIPVTDDEKTAVKADNDAGIAQAQSEIENCQKTAAQMDLVKVEMEKSFAEMKKGIPDENIELVKKHRDEVKAVVQKVYSGVAATQPNK